MTENNSEWFCLDATCYGDPDETPGYHSLESLQDDIRARGQEFAGVTLTRRSDRIENEHGDVVGHVEPAID